MEKAGVPTDSDNRGHLVPGYLRIYTKDWKGMLYNINSDEQCLVNGIMEDFYFLILYILCILWTLYNRHELLL